MNNTSEAGFGFTVKLAVASSTPMLEAPPHSSQACIIRVVSEVPTVRTRSVKPAELVLIQEVSLMDAGTKFS